MRGGLYMYRFQVNGTQYEVQEDQRLIDFLRADLKLTGTKEGNYRRKKSKGLCKQTISIRR